MSKPAVCSLNQFVDVINILISTRRINVFPSDVFKAFKALENAVSQPTLEDKFYPNQKLTLFLKALAQYSRTKVFDPQTDEERDARYLIGFMLHHDIQVLINGKLFSIDDYVHELFRDETSILINYSVLSSQWRANQKYPSLHQVKEAIQRTQEFNSLLYAYNENLRYNQHVRPMEIESEIEQRFSNMVYR